MAVNIHSVHYIRALTLPLQKEKLELREEKGRELWGHVKDFLWPADDWVQI